MGWDIGLSLDFDAWFRTLDDDDQEAVVNAVEQVKRLGADLDSSPIIERIPLPAAPNRRALRARNGRLKVPFTFDRGGAFIRLHGGGERPVV